MFFVFVFSNIFIWKSKFTSQTLITNGVIPGHIENETGSGERTTSEQLHINSNKEASLTHSTRTFI